MPGAGVIARDEFGERRQVGRDREALRRRRGERPDLAGFDMRPGNGDVVEGQLDLAGEQVLRHLPTRAIGHMGHIGAGRDLEQLGRHMGRGTGPRRAERVFAGVLLQEIDQFRHGLGRQIEIDHQDVRHARHLRDRREILDVIIGHPGIDAGVDRMARHRTHGQRVAVGLGPGDRRGPGIAAGSRPVLDNELAAEAGAEPVGQDAPEQVGGAARGEGHHDRDDLAAGIAGLRQGRRRDQAGRTGQQGPACEPRHLFPPLLHLPPCRAPSGRASFGRLALPIAWDLRFEI